NKLNNEGLIYIDLRYGKNRGDFENVLISGNVGSFIWNYDMPYRQSPGLEFELKKNVPDASWIPIDPFTNYEGKHVKQVYNPDGLKMFVPVFNEDKAAAVIEYLEWIASDDLEHVFYLQNGEKGIHYLSYDIEGIPLKRVQNDALMDEQKIQWHDFAFITTGAYEYGSSNLNDIAIAMSYPGFEDKVLTAVKMATEDSFFSPYFGTVIEAEAKYGENLKELGTDIFIKTILASPSDFDHIYDNLVAEYLASGGQDIIDERLAVLHNKK
ncbi:MAG: hypothetical protein PQJ46_12670, partial [Spirochaetales bacterium]|nr:hypothetical protein [Spirochaetales bacterium]